jgi:hypothetical protein
MEGPNLNGSGKTPQTTVPYTSLGARARRIASFFYNCRAGHDVARFVNRQRGFQRHSHPDNDGAVK